MLRRYRGKLAAFGRVAALVTLAIGALSFTWFLSAQYTQRGTYADARAKGYAKGTKGRVDRACIGAKGPALAECVSKEIAASREDQRAEYDLQAQQDSAESGFWTMLFGGAALVVTGIALWYVRRTLDATLKAVDEGEKATAAAVAASEAGRHANRIAQSVAREAKWDAKRARMKAAERNREADAHAQAALDVAQRNAETAARQVAASEATAHKQLRAYVGPQAINYTYDEQGGGGEGRFAASAEVINYGQTPAFKFRMLGSLNYLPFPITELPDIGFPIEATHTLFPTQKTYISVGLPASTQRIYELINSLGCFMFTIVVEYFDLSGQRHLETTRLYTTNNLNLSLWHGTHTATMTYHSSEVHEG